MQNKLIEQMAVVLKDFCLDFKQMPYRHRNEHSVHMQIADYISKMPDIATSPLTYISFPTRRGVDKLWAINRIQKEWPTQETLPKRADNSQKYRRGHFDLAILPHHTQETPLRMESWRAYCGGYTPLPLAVVEVGLDYSAIDHLEPDIAKFGDAKNQCLAFFIHLYRHNSTALKMESERINTIFNKHNVSLLFDPITNEDHVNNSPSAAIVGYKHQTNTSA
jgi:hypothetical protein